MAKRADIRLSRDGMSKMLRSQKVRDELRRRAEEIAARARSIAPVDTGAYRDSIHVEEDTTDRARALVVADDPKAAIIEASRRTLGRSIGGA